MKSDLVGRIALAITVGCLVMVGLTVGALATPAGRARMGLAPAPAPSYAVGARIDVPASVYDASPYTVVLFARSDCGVCQQSKPWLAALTTALQRQSTVRVVMIASGEHLSDEVQYAADLGIGRDRVVPLAPRALKARLVPSLVLVDRQGVVRYSQEGVPRADQGTVLTAMRSHIPTR